MPTPDNYISLEEYQSWLAQPITQIVWMNRQQEIRKWEEKMGCGCCLDGDSADRIALDYAYRCGYIEGLKKAFEAPTVLAERPDDSDNPNEEED